MKKILAFLLVLTGFAAVSCDRGGNFETEYGMPITPYEEKTAVNDSNATLSPEGTGMDAVVTENTSEE